MGQMKVVLYHMAAEQRSTCDTVHPSSVTAKCIDRADHIRTETAMEGVVVEHRSSSLSHLI